MFGTPCRKFSWCTVAGGEQDGSGLCSPERKKACVNQAALEKHFLVILFTFYLKIKGATGVNFKK